MLRLGLCCGFVATPIHFRTTTVKHLLSRKDRPLFLSNLIRDNLENLVLAIDFCADHGIGAFRINSCLMPAYTHPEVGYTIDDLHNSELLLEGFKIAKELAAKREIRLSFHPDQYVVLSSPNPEVVSRSIQEIEYHTVMADLLNADVINIHGGGAYGDKQSALDRFAESFKRLSASAQSKLTVENDDRTYTPSDLLPLCEKLKIPLVYDVHHHRCLPDDLSIQEATKTALQTWNREPLFHLSSPKEGSDPKLHHDFIQPEDFPDEWKALPKLTVDIEAKAKEEAVLRLQHDLKLTYT